MLSQYSANTSIVDLLLASVGKVLDSNSEANFKYVDCASFQFS